MPGTDINDQVEASDILDGDELIASRPGPTPESPRLPRKYLGSLLKSKLRADETSEADAKSGGGTGDDRMSSRRVKQAIDAQVDLEQVRIDEFISLAARIDGYTNLDPGGQDFVGADGTAIATEGTGDPAPLYYAVAFNDADGTSFKDALDLSPGDEFLIHETAGGNYLFGTVKAQAALQDGSNNDNSWRWEYELDAARGLDQYDALPAGAIRIHVRQKGLERDMANVARLAAAAKERLRDDLPTGVEAADGSIDVNTLLMLESFGRLPIGELVEWHDEHHSGIQVLTGLAFTTAGVSNQAGDSGKVAWPGTGTTYMSVNVVNKADLKGALLAKLAAGKKATLKLSADDTKTGIVAVGASYGDGIVTVKFASTKETGALTNNHAADLEVESSIPARNEYGMAVFLSAALNIFGKGGAAGKVWAYLSNAANAKWRRLLDVLKADAGTPAERADYAAALATGRLDVDVAGSGDAALSAAEWAHDSVRLTGLMTGDRIVSLPDKPTGLKYVEHDATGQHNLKLKVSTQDDAAAITLAAGANVVIHKGGSLALHT